jgi:CDP-diacylglycerol--glycerol-3-phosphate 3-phosphatidyltransferase
LNTANKLTMLRVAIIPFFMIVLYLDIPFGYGNVVALVLFIFASITDLVDGQIARRRNQVTDFGKFMDPLADKVLTIAAMCFFVDWGIMSGWALLVVITREFAVTSLRLVAVETGRVIAAGWAGKVKTASSMVCICVMLSGWLPALDGLCVAVIVLTTVYSGIEYFWKNADVIRALNMK